MKRFVILFILALVIPGFALSQTFKLATGSTYITFETDNFGGVSIWRGQLNRTTGKAFIDVPRKTGEIEIAVDMSSINIGNEAINTDLKSERFFDIARYPLATYKGTLAAFNGDRPTQIEGNLTFHGVTRPMYFVIESFKCFQHPIIKREVCGAQASGSFNRAEFGLNYGMHYGFNMEVKLHIQVEAILETPGK